MPSKFLVLWKLELSRLSPEAMKLILRQQDYGAQLEANGKVHARYHLVAAHGGAWIYNVESNEELDALLAQAPVYKHRQLPGSSAGRDAWPDPSRRRGLS